MRIFVDYLNLQQHQQITIDHNFHHIVRVMRRAVGDQIECVTTDGSAWCCTITAIHKDAITLTTTVPIDSTRSPPLHLAFALIKPNRIPTLIEKCAEIGVTHFHPTITQHTQTRFANIERLRSIAESAACQSKACAIPEVYTPTTLEQLPLDNTWVVCCTQTNTPLAAHHDKISGILIGPEGGWSVAELEYMRARSVRSASLGPRTLRTETAAIAASFYIAHFRHAQHPIPA